MASDRLFGFLEILRESIKILSKNGWLMAFTATVFLLLHSLSFLLNVFSTKPIIQDILVKVMALSSMRPDNPEYVSLFVIIGEDSGVFLAVELAFFLVYFFVSIFTKTATISISAVSYSGKNMSLKDLLSWVSRSWTRLLITSFHVTILSLGYMTLFIFFTFLILSVMYLHLPIALIAILVVLAILVTIFTLYLSIVWMLALVISVTEESYGLVALGKAMGIVKGKRLHGFLLNLLVCLLVLVPQMIRVEQLPAGPIVAGLFQSCFFSLVSMFQSIAFTVLYFQCKKNQKSGSVKYTELPTTPQVLEDIL